LTRLGLSTLQELAAFHERWLPYKFLWEFENVKKDIHSVNLTESEASLRRHQELEAELAVEPDMQVFGHCLAISVGNDLRLSLTNSTVIHVNTGCSQKIPVVL
jgi:hypothetical protein